MSVLFYLIEQKKGSRLYQEACKEEREGNPPPALGEAPFSLIQFLS